MIALLRGKVISETFTEIIMDVHGVGYQVFIPMSTYEKLPHDAAKEFTLLTYMQVREDDITLFGFATPAEKQIFELLITVNGIGAKSAVSILSCMNIGSLCNAIMNGDVKVLKKISGVGPKSAERMIVELRDKVAKLSLDGVDGVAGASSASSALPPAAEEALLALEQLGFQAGKCRKIVEKILGELPEKEASTENIIRMTLRNLNGG